MSNTRVSLNANNESSWLYEHRIGLSFMLITLLVGVWFIWSVTAPCSVEINSMGG